MFDIILVLIIIIIISVIVVWYISSNIKDKNNKSELILNDDNDKILSQWLKDNKKLSYNIDLSNEQIAAKFIKRIYDYDVSDRSIVVGNNLDLEYFRLTGKNINTNYTEKEDCILYLRSLLGINYEISIINTSSKLVNNLEKTQHDINLQELNDIMESDLDKIGYDHLRKVLNFRWNKILEITNDKILERNSNDSYLYLKHNSEIFNTTTENSERGMRVNLLCDDVEFNSLITRLSPN